jgi:DNA-binding protein HU-beta
LNNKEFTAELAQLTGHTHKETAELMNSLLTLLGEQWVEGNTLVLQGFGTFEVRKKGERITVNPATQARYLVPPKLALGFRPSSLLKDKFK